MNLSPAMKRALVLLYQAGGKGSAYGLKSSLGTMNALEARKFVVPHDTSGWMYSPQTCHWRFTKKGTAAALAILAEQDKDK